MEVRKLSRRLVLGAAFIATGGAALAVVPAASAQQPLRIGPAAITHIGMPGVGPAAQGDAATAATTYTSTNWSGYAINGGTNTSVTTTWIQPAVNCSVTPSSYAAFWAGLDGFSSSTVEQDGTLAECVNSGGRHSSQVAEYIAWYETYPNPMYQFGGTVAPGDTLTATVTSISPTQYVLTLADTPANASTKPWSVSTTQTLKRAAARSSAEVIAEAPSSNFGVLPLADFGDMSFSSSSLLPSLNPVAIDMISRRGAAEATPGALGSTGGFSDQWQ